MKKWRIIFGLLILLSGSLGLLITRAPDERFHLVACDVGQGDAFLAYYGQTQILFDAGAGTRVLDCLAKYLAPDDRTIELVILTHPQIDHFGGLIEVFDRYQVDSFLFSELDSGTLEYQVLKSKVGGSGIKVIRPDEDLRLRMGKIYLDILHPSEAFVLSPDNAKKDANDFSIVVKLSFDNFDALLTGDISPESETLLVGRGLITPVEYLKVPHHGSKNGLTQQVLDLAEPEVAIISVGKNNSYGLPSPEIITILEQKGVKTLRTDTLGDIEVISDGQNWQVKN